ncbi:hypothetical protein ACH82I_11260 [Brevibacterium sp. GP-SGM9]|uniref:hypothetical protein n=1 Tax=Brevibacterium sp. GP-SGM9 TaxID=3376990 RepID=UPI0039A4B0CF
MKKHVFVVCPQVCLVSLGLGAVDGADGIVAGRRMSLGVAYDHVKVALFLDAIRTVAGEFVVRATELVVESPRGRRKCDSARRIHGFSLDSV